MGLYGSETFHWVVWGRYIGIPYGSYRGVDGGWTATDLLARRPAAALPEAHGLAEVRAAGLRGGAGVFTVLNGYAVAFCGVT
jgi:hypothetical protein